MDIGSIYDGYMKGRPPSTSTSTPSKSGKMKSPSLLGR